MRVRCNDSQVQCRSALFALLFWSCSGAGLQPIDDVKVNVVDDLLELHGTVCTDPPEATNFPVKILFIIDGSGSMQFTDMPAKRALATEEVILRLRDNPSVSFAVIRFNGGEDVLTKPGAAISSADPFGTDLSGAFTRDPTVLQMAVQGLRVADSATDYQGALATAYQVLAKDMTAVSKAELSRTKYVLLFLSDGSPFPKCCRAMRTDNLCDPRTNLPFCSDPDQIHTNPTLIPYYTQADEDYNQDYQIFAQVRDIMNLGEMLGVGEMRLHTALLFDPSLITGLAPDGSFIVAGVDFVNLPRATALLKGMAQIGMGVFRDFSKSEQIDFLGFDLTNIKRENSIKNLIITDMNQLLTKDGLKVDSDGDGISDEQEFMLGLNRLSRDSDGDGFNDKIELDNMRLGLDPGQMNPGCEMPSDKADVDGDGLAKCEEVLLRTSTELFDTDADGIPDGTEVFLGTNPVKSDALEDADLDGIRNGDEIRFHTNVSLDESTTRSGFAYRYKTSELGLNDKGENCYQFEIKNIQLGTPLARPGETDSYGRNDILIYLAQAPTDNPYDFGTFKIACVHARYVAPDFKDPLEGVVDIKPEDFKDPDQLDMHVDCVGLTASPSSAP
jgi:VWA domain-containing protein/thrombospondin type 3 repeat protein